MYLFQRISTASSNSTTVNFEEEVSKYHRKMWNLEVKKVKALE